MGKCPIRLHFDKKPESGERGYFICAICECNLGMHAYYVHCPLLDDELICIDCCHDAVPEKGIEQKFKELGVEHTREKIEATCRDCGNRSVGKSLEEEAK